MHISIMLVFWSLVLLFGIVWCRRSISCFRLLASLPYISIVKGIITKRLPLSEQWGFRFRQASTLGYFLLFFTVRKNDPKLEPFFGNIIIENGIVFPGKGGNAPCAYSMTAFF